VNEVLHINNIIITGHVAALARRGLLLQTE